MSWERSFRGVALYSLVGREVASDGRALADGRINTHLAAVQFDKGAHQRQAETGAAVPRPVGMALKPVEHLVLDVGRNAWTGIGHGKDHRVIGPLRANADDCILRREAHGVGEQVVQNLHDAAFVTDKTSDAGIDVDLEADAVGGQAILNAFGGGFDGLADIDRTELELHGAGIDGGEIENVVGERQQRVGRFGDVLQVFGLFRGQRAGRGIAQEMREADDGGQRRAQLVGDVVDEIHLHLVSRLQRLVAFAERPLDIFGIGDVLECQHGGAVRQRPGHAVQHAAVLTLQLQRHVDPVLDRGDRFTDRPPAAHVIEQRPAPIFNGDRKSTRLNSSHVSISYAVFCLKKKKKTKKTINILKKNQKKYNYVKIALITYDIHYSRLIPLYNK